MVGPAFTVTTTGCDTPVQPPAEVGVTVYVTLSAVAEDDISVLLNVLVLCRLVLSPVTLVLLAAIQV